MTLALTSRPWTDLKTGEWKPQPQQLSLGHRNLTVPACFFTALCKMFLGTSLFLSPTLVKVHCRPSLTPGTGQMLILPLCFCPEMGVVWSQGSSFSLPTLVNFHLSPVGFLFGPFPPHGCPEMQLGGIWKHRPFPLSVSFPSSLGTAIQGGSLDLLIVAFLVTLFSWQSLCH